MRILLIEDDEALRAVLVPVLEKAGFGCDSAADGASGLALLLQNPYDAAVVDRMLPALSGLELVRAARGKGCTVPVLMLTALVRVEGLGAGADDYLVKPFDNRELIARLQALGRRPARTLESALLRFCDVSLDAAALTLTGPAGTARLSRNENALLEALLRRAGQLVSREVLFCAVWGAEDFVEEGNLDSYIHFVRRRLRTVGSRAVIRTVRGMGYCLEAGGDAP